MPGLYNGRNKLFWMFSYEGTRRRQAVTTTTLVPTLKERAGDFSGLPATIVDPFTKIPFPGNVIPANRINPVGAALVTLYPAANNADPSRNYVGHPQGVSNNDVFAARIDYQAGRRTPSGAASRGAVQPIAASARLCRRHSRDSIKNSRTTTCRWPSEMFIPSLRPSSTK